MQGSGLNPNYVLAAIVATVVASLAAMGSVFITGGPTDTVLTRIGLVTAFVVPTITALIAMLMSGIQHQQVNRIGADLQTHKEELAGTEERVSAIEQVLPANGAPAAPAAQK